MKGLCQRATIMVKGGNWISDAAPNPTISGPEITHVSVMLPRILVMMDKKPLSSNGLKLGLDIQWTINTNLFPV